MAVSFLRLAKRDTKNLPYRANQTNFPSYYAMHVSTIYALYHIPFCFFCHTQRVSILFTTLFSKPLSNSTSSKTIF